MHADTLNKPLDHATALPARYYLGEAMLAMERRAVFARSWQLVAQQRQRGEPDRGQRILELVQQHAGETGTLGQTPLLPGQLLRSAPDLLVQQLLLALRQLVTPTGRRSLKSNFACPVATLSPGLRPSLL